MKGLLVLGGKNIELKKFVECADIIICADSGAEHIIKQGFMPRILLGDMDSISENTFDICKKANVEIIKYREEKDKTDGQLAIDYSKDNNIDELDIVCAEGSIDHYLGNLYLLFYAKRKNVISRLHTQDMTVYITDSNITLHNKKETRVSIMPADGEIIVKSTLGLYYEVGKPLTINFGDTIGLGNHMTQGVAEIIIDKGTAFVIVKKKGEKEIKNTWKKVYIVIK